MRNPVLANTRSLSIPLMAAALTLAGCGGVPINRSADSIHQPVIQHDSFSLDVTTGPAGLTYGERERLVGWFEAMNLKYGDRVYLEDASSDPAVRDVIETAVSHFGATLVDAAPQSAAVVATGMTRVTIARTSASVPGCPEWTTRSDFNPNNGLSSNYGCAVNSNLAAMVANPDDLVHGRQNSGSTAVMTSNKAIDAYRNAKPTGKGNAISETDSRKD